jgi:hypothetical protein
VSELGRCLLPRFGRPHGWARAHSLLRGVGNARWSLRGIRNDCYILGLERQPGFRQATRLGTWWALSVCPEEWTTAGPGSPTIIRSDKPAAARSSNVTFAYGVRTT